MDKFNIIDEPIPGVKLIKTKPIKDDRGFFERVLCVKEFEKIGLNKKIVNINHSKTKDIGTIRGMHFQYQPATEIKIVKCITGSIYDVIVDIRENSPTFLQHFGVELNDKNNLILYIPEGFAHGFQTLEEDSEIIYFVTNYYSKELESGLNPFDEKLNIKWPIKCTNISDKDKKTKMLDEFFIGLIDD